MTNTSSYSLALVGAGVRLPDMLICARLFLDVENWAEVRSAIVKDNILALNKESTKRRIAPEMIRRLKTLSKSELEHFTSCFGDDQYAYIWLMCCRSYQFMWDFSVQVLAKRYQDLMPDVSENSYLAFAEEQEYEHEEYRVTTNATKGKIKSTIFTMMRDCNLITKQNQITPLYPSERFVDLVRQCSPADLSIFPQAGALL